MRRLLILSVLLASVAAQGKISTPSITVPNMPRTHFFAGDAAVTLKCEATGNPSYKWERDGTPVKEEINPRTRETMITYDSSTGDLTIPKYSDIFNGDYRCLATIGDVSSMSQLQKLRESKLPTFKAGSGSNQKINEFDYVVIVCSNQGDVAGAPGDISYKWYWSKESAELLMDDGRLFIDSKGNLHFTYVKESDKTTATKKYRCGYSSVTLATIRLGLEQILEVTKGNPSGIKPVLRYYSENVKGMLNGEAELECFYAGYDPSTTDHLPTIKWFDSNDNEIVTGAKFEINREFKGRILKIKDLKEEDDKNYFCQASTLKAGNSDKQAVRLDVTSPPIWVKKAPETVTKMADQSAIFKCDARSLKGEAPPGEPEWYINGKKFDTTMSLQKYVFSDGKKILTINNLKKPKDIQCVSCIVKNNIGSLMGDACLNVVSPIKVNSRPPAVQEIKFGDTIDLTVVAHADNDISTPLNYEWIYRNTTYHVSGKSQYPPHVTFDPTSSKTFLNTSKLTRDQYENVGGVYSYRIFDFYGEVFVDTEAKLMDITTPPPAPVAASAGIDMWIIGLIIGIVFLFIVIAIIIFVICRKQQEGDYNVDKKETGAGLDPEKELRDKGFNDLSRPDYDDYDYPEKKPRGDLEYDDVPIGGDDESLGEYGDEEDTHFNEDGSFIGIYQKKENERQNHKTESTI